MNCQQAQEQFDQLLDASLTVLDCERLQRHLTTCEHCSEQLETLKVLRSHLQRIPIEEAGTEFETRMLEALDHGRDSKQATSSWFPAAMGGAIAASILTWTLMTPGVVIPKAQEPSLAVVHNIALEVNRAESIRLAFNSPEAMQQVTVSIGLPAHLEIEGFPDQQQLTWKTDLVAGQNVLTLPLIARYSASGELVARISDANKSKVFRIKTIAGTGTKPVSQLGSVNAVI